MRVGFAAELLTVLAVGLLGGLVFAVVKNDSLEWLCLLVGGSVAVALLHALFGSPERKDE